MRCFLKYLLPALLLALCLSLAACGSGGDTDTDTDAAPDSFEGMVKDGDRMASLSDYGGTWAGDDGSTMLVEAGGDGDEVRFALYDAGDEVTASGFIQFVPDYGCDYFYNEHDGAAYRSRLDEAGALDVVSLGTFAKVSGDLPGRRSATPALRRWRARGIWMPRPTRPASS